MATEWGAAIESAPPTGGWLRQHLAAVLAGTVVLTAVVLYLAATAPVDSYVHVVLASAPTAYWRMDTAGPQEPDVSGGGHNASYYNSPGHLVKGLVAGGDTAVRLRGNYLVVPHGALHFGLEQPFTISAWVKLTSSRSIQTVMAVAVGANVGFAVVKEPRALGSRFVVAINKRYSVVGRALPATKPQYLVLTYDGLHTYALYENGTLAAPPRTVSSLGYSDRPKPLVIGAANTAGVRPANGILDDVALWNRVMPAREILRQYKAGGG